MNLARYRQAFKDKAVAQLLPPERAALGGGDDFVILFQSEDWLARCKLIVSVFNEKALDLFDPEALSAGGIQAEDRHGDT